MKLIITASPSVARRADHWRPVSWMPILFNSSRAAENRSRRSRTTGRALFSPLPAAVDAVGPTPVLAAGSISDGRGLAATMMLGADGVLIGTRLYATSEALGSGEAKRRICKASGDGTIRTRVFDLVRGLPWPKEYTGRALVNDFTSTLHGREAALAASLDQEAERYETAREVGDLDTAVIFAGEDVDLIRDCPSAEKVISRIMSEAHAIMLR